MRGPRPLRPVTRTSKRCRIGQLLPLCLFLQQLSLRGANPLRLERRRFQLHLAQ